jgi:hypothetical protein
MREAATGRDGEAAIAAKKSGLASSVLFAKMRAVGGE